MNGILDENHINQKLVYKQNMYAEIMTMKDALRPYQQHLIQIQHREINIMNLRKSKDFYRVYIQNLHHDANELALNHTEKYCEYVQDLHALAFTSIQMKWIGHGIERDNAPSLTHFLLQDFIAIKIFVINTYSFGIFSFYTQYVIV